MSSNEDSTKAAGDRDDIVRVTIFGQEYPVRSGIDPGYLREIAAYLDHRMAEIHRTEPSRTTLRIAVLAALNLADELFTLRKEKQGLEQRYEQKVQQLTEHLNRVLTD